MAFPLGYVATLATVQAAGNAVAATTTQTSLLTGGASQALCTLPANWIEHVGQQFNIKASGIISTPVATQGNLTLSVVFNTTPINVAVSPSFTSLANQTNITWRLDWDLTVRAVGSGTSSNFIHTGEFRSALVSLTSELNLIPASAPVVGTGYNSTTANTVDLQATWSNSTAGNTITLYQYALTSLINY